MLDLLLPRNIDKTYRGHKLALWLFGFVVFSKLTMGLNCVFNGYFVARNADGIPLDSYTHAGTQTVLFLFAAWGLGQVMLGLLGLVALLRYRAMVPLAFALLLLEHASRRFLALAIPVERVGSPSGPLVNWVLLGVMVVGLALALRRQGKPRPLE
jgi:hypothetical protein